MKKGLSWRYFWKKGMLRDIYFHNFNSYFLTHSQASSWPLLSIRPLTRPGCTSDSTSITRPEINSFLHCPLLQKVLPCLLANDSTIVQGAQTQCLPSSLSFSSTVNKTVNPLDSASSISHIYPPRPLLAIALSKTYDHFIHLLQVFHWLSFTY